MKAYARRRTGTTQPSDAKNSRALLAFPMCSDLETAMQLLKLAQRYLDRGELAKAAQALSQAGEIVTAAAKHQPRQNPQS